MRRAIPGLALAVLAAAGCGAGDGGTAASDGGAQEAKGAAGGPGALTAEEFLPKLLPEKTMALEAVVSTVSDCRGVEVEPSFVLLVSDAASRAEPDTPLSELVEAEC